MGFMLMTAECGACRQLFTCNPDLVPSLNNIPFCKNCMEHANAARVAKGLPPHIILPGAYDPQEVL